MAEPVLIHLLEVSPVIALELGMKETHAKLVNTINNSYTWKKKKEKKKKGF